MARKKFPKDETPVKPAIYEMSSDGPLSAAFATKPLFGIKKRPATRPAAPRAETR
jgi:hypothetical protein